MPGRVGGVAMLIGALLAAPPVAWAESSQAVLAVSVVVPARCAVRMPGTVLPADLPMAGPRGAVTMRCTKGAVTVPGAVDPQITRSFVLPTVAPRPMSETGQIAVADTSGPRMVITVNF